MIELRTMYCFAAACRAETLTLAAKSLGIALSTLSQTLKRLEQSFDQPLFRRADGLLHPTAFARGLLKSVDALLLNERSAHRWLHGSEADVLRPLIVELPPGFIIGGLDHSVLRAADAFGMRHPDILVDVRWHDARERSPVARTGTDPQDRIVIALETEHAIRAGAKTLLRDPWVFARHYPQGTRDRPSLAQISTGRIVVPSLPRLLTEQAHGYFRDQDIRGVRFLKDHPDDLAQTLHDHPDAILFIPRSLIAPRLGLPPLVAIAPRSAPVVRITGHQPLPGRETGAFLRALRRALADPGPTVFDRPAMTSRSIIYFNATDRLRRISAAAKASGISQPSLSEQLQKLESIIGAPLFERRDDGVVPTSAGGRFAILARRLETGLAQITNSGASADRTQSRRVAIGILPSVHQHGYLVNRIADALIDVQTRRPALTLTVQEAPNAVLQDWVMRGTVGIAIVETTLPHMPRLALGSSESLAAIADARHGLFAPGPVRLAELVAQKLVVPTHRFGLRQLLEAAADTRGLRIQPFLEIDALTMIVALLARLPICAVLPPSAVEREAASGELSVHPIVDPTIQRKLFVIYSGERMLSDAERDLVNTLRRKLTEPPPAAPS